MFRQSQGGLGLTIWIATWYLGFDRYRGRICMLCNMPLVITVMTLGDNTTCLPSLGNVRY